MNARFLWALTCIATVLAGASGWAQTTPPPKETFPLWADGAPGAVAQGEDHTPKLEVYLPEPDKATGAAIIVCPGGGYRNLAATYEGQDVARWEAFLVYGSPVVSSPVNHSMYREDQARREIASLIFAQLTDEYGIPPSAYDADKAFQRCLTLMHKFNIYELQDFQPGHLEPFRNYMFPSE